MANHLTTQHGRAVHRVIPEDHIGQRHSFFGDFADKDPATVAEENRAYTEAIQANFARHRPGSNTGRG